MDGLDFDYLLNSPCIDSGDPELIDPDGTISDIGANNLQLIEDVTVSIEPLIGWNMVGLPVNLTNPAYDIVFENTLANTLYSFGDVGGYITEEVLIPGTGYWIRLTDDATQTITGPSLNEVTIQLFEGWNLISGVSFEIELYEIIDPEGLIIEGTLYSFTGGYSEVSTLSPGRAYWVRSSDTGEITISR